jgi:hypothetical protein
VDVNTGYMSCTSMFRGHELDIIQFGNCDSDEGGGGGGGGERERGREGE